jgi:hypothetical protein
MESADLIRAVIVDDHHLARVGLARTPAGSGRIEACATLASTQELADTLDGLSPDVRATRPDASAVPEPTQGLEDGGDEVFVPGNGHTKARTLRPRAGALRRRRHPGRPPVPVSPP